MERQAQVEKDGAAEQKEAPARDRLLADFMPPAAKSGNEKVLDIADVDKTLGWWQKKQYEDLGVQKIHLFPNAVTLDLKKPAEKYNTLQIDKKFSFNFTEQNGGWTLTNVQGLKHKGSDIEKVESSGSKIKFYMTDGKQKEYGSAVNNFMKALLDPLMRKDLRN